MPTTDGFWSQRTTPTPFLRSYLYLVDTGHGGNVEFVVGTGADRTSIHPVDWTAIAPRSRWNDWPEPHYMAGIAGSRPYSTVPAVIAFLDPDGRWFVSRQFTVEVGLLLPSDRHLLAIPSLLGMDLIGTGTLHLTGGGKITLDIPGTYV